MMILRLLASGLLFCIPCVFAAILPEVKQSLDPKTKTFLDLYMSSKSKQGNDYIEGMLSVAKESLNICLSYLAAKTLAEKSGFDTFSTKAKAIGDIQLKAIFIKLEKDPDRLRKDCLELKSSFASDIIKSEDDPYSEFVIKEVNPLFQRDQHIYVKLKIAEYSNDPQKLAEILQEPYIKDDTREQVLSLLKTHHSSASSVLQNALLLVFNTANTLTLKENCLNQLLANPSNRQWLQSGLQLLSQILKTGDVYFCPLLEKTIIPSQWPDLLMIRLQTLNECKKLNRASLSSIVR